MIKHALLIAIGIASLVLNPFFGCDGDEEFRFGADEMRSAIEGTWKLTVPASGGTPAHELVLSISQAAAPTQQQSRRPGLVADAAACTQRSLVRSAGACGDESEMPLEVTLLAGGLAKGMFRVVGTRFTRGYLDLEIGEHFLRAMVAPTGAVSDVRTDASGATGVAGASMVRVTKAQP